MALRVRFFGKFELRYADTPITDIRSQKSLEMLAYLLLKRSALSRETLASVIWGDQASPDQSRKYLRNTLWQLQKTFSDHVDDEAVNFLLVDSRSISVDPSFPVWTDIEEFESKCDLARDVDGAELTDEQAASLRQAVDLFTAPFLEGWFCDWCLLYRERTQHLTLLMLDKLMHRAVVQEEYESGILYGERILSYDRAREVTHRNLMKMFYFSGDRTSALRQYQHCAAILRDELDIEPSERTRQVFDFIRNDTLEKGRPNAGL